MGGLSDEGKQLSSTSTSPIYLHAAEPTLINIFGDSEKIVEKDICSISRWDFGKQKKAEDSRYLDSTLKGVGDLGDLRIGGPARPSGKRPASHLLHPHSLTHLGAEHY